MFHVPDLTSETLALRLDSIRFIIFDFSSSWIDQGRLSSTMKCNRLQTTSGSLCPSIGANIFANCQTTHTLQNFPQLGKLKVETYQIINRILIVLILMCSAASRVIMLLCSFFVGHATWHVQSFPVRSFKSSLSPTEMTGSKMDKTYRGLDSQSVPTLRVQASRTGF